MKALVVAAAAAVLLSAMPASVGARPAPRIVARIVDRTTHWRPLVRDAVAAWSAALGAYADLEYVESSPSDCAGLTWRTDDVVLCESPALDPNTAGSTQRAAHVDGKELVVSGLVELLGPPRDTPNTQQVFLVIHELGHVFGLNHQPPDVESVMVESGRYSYQLTAPTPLDVDNVLAYLGERLTHARRQAGHHKGRERKHHG